MKNGNNRSIGNNHTITEEVCPICGGLGLVARDVPLDHPDFGKVFPCVCQADKVKARRTDNLRKLSNLGAYADKTFNTFQIDHTRLVSPRDDYLRTVFPHGDRIQGFTKDQQGHVNAAAESAYRYAQNPQGWLLLKGPYGTGKSHLAAAIGNYCLEKGVSVVFITAADLLDYLRTTYAPSSEVGYDERF